MAKCRAPRKGIKRAPRRPQAADHDGELAELASVIAEYSLDNNAEGWFKPAWRDGWNAVELAVRAAADYGLPVCSVDSWLNEVVSTRRTSNDVYWVAQERLLM